MSDSPPAPETDWALFLDIDGTLLTHAETPDAVYVDDALRELLERLRRQNGGALALVSGRAIADVDALFEPLVLPVAGQHGVEWRDAAGNLHHLPFPEEHLRQVAQRFAAFKARHPGIVFEDKGHSLALHYRLAPQLEREVRTLVEHAVADLGQNFELQAGKLVCELKPGGHDKGTAIEAFLSTAPFEGRTPVFIGDDLTDEYGFATVQRLGGHAVKVGEGESTAEWRLADVEAVRGWLGSAVK
ncbi:MAG: trehalose-phosphatase [bacterium]|jgi:trehalose 6-phosphate phosphatase